MTALWVFLAALAILVIIGIAIFNSLVRLRQQVDNAWSQIDVQLRRRYDLIPNLVETVRGYMQYEQATLEKVILARQRAIEAQGVRQQAEAENA
ncbi:MAG: LemA family protein, partial [Fimbriimonadales bacterium]|nr:LemA family protein [Fimbriimonadales bacterium]